MRVPGVTWAKAGPPGVCNGGSRCPNPPTFTLTIDDLPDPGPGFVKVADEIEFELCERHYIAWTVEQ